MKFLTLIILLFPIYLYSQNVSIGNNPPDANAKLDIQSTTGGVLIPRLTSTERDAIPAPIANGLLIYNAENLRFEFWNGSAWGPIASASSGGSEISDEDGDTRISVEESIDEDTLRFYSNGHQIMKLDNKSLQLEGVGRTTLIGLNAGKYLPSSDNWNTFIGYRTGEMTNSGISNTFLGAYSGSDGNKGNSNSFVGVLSGEENTGSNNTFLGIQTGQKSSGSSDNIYIGAVAGQQNTGSSNIGIGYFSSYTGNGSNNIGIGRYSLFTVANGSSELLAIGDSTLYLNGQGAFVPFQGIRNTAVGHKTLKKNRIGTNNTALGYHSLENNNSGSNNTALGANASNSNQTGFNNTALGSIALFDNTAGVSNTAVGTEAGRFSQGSRNTFLGNKSGTNNISGSGNVFIGNQAGEFETGSDKLFVANSNTSSPLIQGDFAESILRINETLLIDNFKSNDSILKINASGINSFAVYAENTNSSSSRSTAEFKTNSGLAAAIRGINTESGAFANAGGYFQSRGQFGYGVYGVSTKSTEGYGAGGEFVSFGDQGKGVIGKSTFVSDTTNYGGYFTASGKYGIGTYASAPNNQGIGLLARGGRFAAHLDGDTYISGKTGIGKSPGNATLEIDQDLGQTPMSVFTGGLKKFEIHANGGLSIGSGVTPPIDGLLVANLGNTGDHRLRVNDAGIIYKDEQNEIKSYSPPAFVDNPLTGFAPNNSPSFKLIPGGTFVWADWGLPHGSVAKTFKIYLGEAETDESILVEIMKKSIDSAAGPTEIASFMLFGAGSNSTATGSIVLNETIDNQNNSYYFRIWNQNVNDSVWILGVTQSYRE